MAKGVLIQPSFYEAMKILPDNERLLLYDSLCEYSLHGVEPENLPPTANSFFIMMRPNIDSSNNRYAASVANGSKGGAPKGNQNARKQPKNNQRNNQTKQPKNKQDYDLDSDYDSNLDSDCDSDTSADKPHRTRFIPPSVEEVREYCQSRNNNVDPQRFVDHYTSNGWKVGRNKMKDWKAAVHTWERNEYNRTEGANGKNKRDDQETGWELPGVTRF